jgi:hypothetical protein
MVLHPNPRRSPRVPTAPSSPRGAPPGGGGRRAGGRLGEEDSLRDPAVRALGRLPRRQVRRRSLRPERHAGGARVQHFDLPDNV